MITRFETVASNTGGSRSRVGAAPRRPSAGVAVVRRVGPLERATGRERPATPGRRVAFPLFRYVTVCGAVLWR